MMKRLTLALALLPAVAFAQPPQTTKRVTLPTIIGVPATNKLPFSEDRIRYQQWYDGSQMAATVKQPVRIIGLEFLGGARTGVTYDIEITLANGSTSLQGVFANNLVDNKVVCLSRANVTPPSGAILPFMFPVHYKWDGQSNVVVDIKIWANGLGQAYNYSAQSTISRVSNVKRQYRIGYPNATTANSSGATGHYGLVTRFLYQEGGTYDYGFACPGGQSHVPVGTANAVPMPGLATYTQLLSKAGSGYPAIFFIGVSKTTYNGTPLPFPLAFLGGPNCSMQASPHLILFTTTVGGGPGAGNAKVKTPIPPIGALAGVRVYSQWVILDKAAPNGNLSATKGLMHVVGS